jgi:FkbM family methyltransferase
MHFRRLLRDVATLFGRGNEPHASADPSLYFLPQVRGVIHIGANSGQERKIYAERGLPVIWIEAAPGVFRRLQRNIRRYPAQKAFHALITDTDDREYSFHISDNREESSSIFEFKRHRDLWPQVRFARTITLRSLTLPALLEREQIALAGYDALVLDTQGSELLILRGAEPILRWFRFIKVEAADFESYAGGCTLAEIDSFLSARNFQRTFLTPIAGKTGIGSCFEAVFERQVPE